jgi:hypothetical protein
MEPPIPLRPRCRTRPPVRVAHDLETLPILRPLLKEAKVRDRVRWRRNRGELQLQSARYGTVGCCDV